METLTSKMKTLQSFFRITNCQSWKIFWYTLQSTYNFLICLNLYCWLYYRYLTLGALNQLIESCTNLTSVNYLINWKSISRPELLSFWRCLRENNIDIDFGEKEFKEVQNYTKYIKINDKYKWGHAKKERKGGFGQE